jgi:hypothetical protein
MANRRSRLARKEEARSLRKAALFGFLTVLLALALVFLGIPIMIRVAIFIGELRSTSLPVETQDTIPPSPPRFKPFPEATNSAQISVSGYSEGGATIKLYLNGSENQEVIAENSGEFIFTRVSLSGGQNDLQTTATDSDGNTSQRSNEMSILFDNEPPELEVSEPEENAAISGDDNKIFVKGKTEPEAYVTVNERIAILGADGSFEQPLSLSEGENTVMIVATDKAGNQTEKEIKVNYSP